MEKAINGDGGAFTYFCESSVDGGEHELCQSRGYCVSWSLMGDRGGCQAGPISSPYMGVRTLTFFFPQLITQVEVWKGLEISQKKFGNHWGWLVSPAGV